jgi:hypothetical protein
LNDGATTLFSHHARFLNDDLNTISYFDNTVFTQKLNCTEDCTKGRVVKVNTTDMTAVNLKQYYHPLSIQSGPEGSFTVTDSGTVLIGWGASPFITEHHPLTTEAIFDVQFSIFGAGFDNYRAFKSAWVGRPLWAPSIASTTDGNSSVVWVSWNGATEVTNWVLVSSPREILVYPSLQICSTAQPTDINRVQLGSNDANATLWNSSQILAQVPKGGFETGIAINSTVKYARIAGLDLSGATLGATDVLEVATGIQSTAAGPVVLNISST